MRSLTLGVFLLVFGAVACELESRNGRSGLMAQEAPQLELWSHDPPINGAKPSRRPWRDLVGKRVEVEGLAWGVFEKGPGEYVILNKAVVYVRDAKFLRAKAEGKLVRVRGVLDVRQIEAAEANAGGVGRQRQIFELHEVKWEFIDKVTWPWLREYVES